MVPAMTRSPPSLADPSMPQCGGARLFAASGLRNARFELRDAAPENGFYHIIFNNLNIGYQMATVTCTSRPVAYSRAAGGAKFPGSVVALQGGLAYVPASLRAPQLGRIFFESAAQ